MCVCNIEYNNIIYLEYFVIYFNVISTHDLTQTSFFNSQDCGSTDPPAVAMLGGWAKQNQLGVVAAASRTGRIFCHTLQINGTEPVTVTAQMIQEVR